MVTRSMLHYIAGCDYKIMRRTNNWPAPRWLRLWMLTATRCGDGWVWYAVGALVVALGGSERFAALMAASSALLIGVTLFMLLKRQTRRPRPGHFEPHCWATILPPDEFSFPSGHTITAFCIAVSVGLFYPTSLPALLFCASNIGISRVVLGMHFLSDVVAGAVLGGFVGYAAWFLYS